MIFSFNREKPTKQEQAVLASDNFMSFPELVERFGSTGQSEKIAAQERRGIPFFDDIRKNRDQIDSSEKGESVARQLAVRHASYIEQIASLDDEKQAAALVVAVAKAMPPTMH